MLRLAAIEVQGFRAFAGWTRLELRPLTLLYGRNNAGKSSLLRLLALIADSVGEGARSAIEMHGPAGRGGRFKDLPWTGDGVPREKFRLLLVWEQDGIPFGTDEFELAWVDERTRAIVRRLWVRDAERRILLEAAAEPFPDEELYRIDDREPLRVLWEGLAPRDENNEILATLRSRMMTLRGSVTWLDSNRPRPERVVPARDAIPREFEHDGSNALEFLAADRDLYAKVHAWFAREPIERDLRLKPVGEGHLSPYLGAVRSPAEFHILDAGEGMAHVLPVVVAANLVGRAAGHRVLAIEEPESHLHGDTQRSLTRHLAQLAAVADPPIFLLETHSRAALLGLQLAVAEGLLPRERAQVLWCEQDATGVSSLTQVEVASDGGLRGWPRSALASESEMVRTLLDLQDQRKGT